MKVLFATAELAPLVRVGGLAEAASGLVRALRRRGVNVEVALPDYFGTVLQNESVSSIDGPDWVGPIRIRRGELDGFGDLTLIDAAGTRRPHPYVALESGEGWPDNDQRFFAFSWAVAELARIRKVQVVHLNDWHTAAAVAWLPPTVRSVLSLHNLAHQGIASGEWLERFRENSPQPDRVTAAFECFGAVNPLGGAIQLVQKVIAVSPNYAAEITGPKDGFGLETMLQQRGLDLIGILNGIDAEEWSPATDPHLVQRYATLNAAGLRAKHANRAKLLASFDLDDTATGPVIAMVSRLVEQKGVDLLLDAAQYLDSWNARLVVLGAGDPGLGAALHQRARTSKRTVGFQEGYDLALAHQIFGGADLFVMPSRFEPCGLAQMQAMAYGTIPVTTSVGGLVDTVIDFDSDPGAGNGFRSPHSSGAGLVDAIHRAVRAWTVPARRKVLLQNAMQRDWSWTEPAARYGDVYRQISR